VDACPEVIWNWLKWKFAIDRFLLIPGAGNRAIGAAIYKLHRGERSNDLKRLPTASRRQCQTSALSFEGYWPALFFDALPLVYRRGDATELILALASFQCPLVFLMVAGLLDGVSAGIVFVAGTIISVFARALSSSSLSAFAGSFSTNAGSILL
jgi:hypothetical protein